VAYPYCLPASATDFLDERRLAQLLGDSNTGPISVASIPTNPRLSVHLLLASNRLDRVLLEGRRYSADELNAFAATDNGVILRWLCANLAFGSILGRRKETQPEWANLAEDVESAESQLELYRLGKLILPINDAKLDANTPALATLGINNGDPVVNVQRPYGWVDAPIQGVGRNWGPNDPSIDRRGF
jgi:hypothetical protein